jgi:Tubulin folding cofactor D C terminal
VPVAPLSLYERLSLTEPLACEHYFGRKVLLGLFRSHSRDGRVILPLLKSIEILLSHRHFDELLQSNDKHSFKRSLLKCISTEAKNCKDVHRLFACIDVALGLVSSPSDDGPVSSLIIFGVPDPCFYSLPMSI